MAEITMSTFLVSSATNKESKDIFLITSFTPKSLAMSLASSISTPTYLVLPFSLVVNSSGG